MRSIYGKKDKRKRFDLVSFYFLFLVVKIFNSRFSISLIFSIYIVFVLVLYEFVFISIYIFLGWRWLRNCSLVFLDLV